MDTTAFAEFRAGLLRHIAMEEKALLPDARPRNGELPIARQLRADHAALVSLLVPTPTHELVAAIRNVLDEHNPLEENPDGLYGICERLAGAEVETLLARIRATPEVPIKPYFDSPRVHEHIANLLRARACLRGE